MHDNVGEALADAVRAVAHAITAPAAPSPDETGGVVGSATEALMGITAGLVRIAQAVESLTATLQEGFEALAQAQAGPNDHDLGEEEA